MGCNGAFNRVWMVISCPNLKLFDDIFLNGFQGVLDDFSGVLWLLRHRMMVSSLINDWWDNMGQCHSVLLVN